MTCLLSTFAPLLALTSGALRPTASVIFGRVTGGNDRVIPNVMTASATAVGVPIIVVTNGSTNFARSFLWEMPYLRRAKNWRRADLGGWRLNGIPTLQSGLLFSVTAANGRSLAGVGLDCADVSGPEHDFNNSDYPAEIQKFLGTGVFSRPALGRWEMLNSLNRPNFLNPVNVFTRLVKLTSTPDPRIMPVVLRPATKLQPACDGL